MTSSYQMVHVVTVKNRNMQITRNPVIVEDGQMVNVLVFEFDAEWAGLSVDFFLSDGKSEAYRFHYDGEPYAIPTQLISEPGVLQVGVIGYIGADVRLTVAKMLTPFAVIAQSVNGEQEPPEPIEDIYGQISGALDDTKELDKKLNETLSSLDGLVEAANEAISDVVDAVSKANEAAEAAREAAEAATSAIRGTQVSVTDGRPTIGGIEGDSAIDPETGTFWEFVDDGSTY